MAKRHFDYHVKAFAYSAMMAGLAASGTAAFAQTAVPSSAEQAAIAGDPPSNTLAQAADNQAAATRELVVTGTRITRNGYDAPTPTTVLSSALLEAKAPATIIDALVTLPAFKNSSTASTAGVGNSGSARGARDRICAAELGYRQFADRVRDRDHRP